MTQKIEKLETLLQKTIKHKYISNVILHVQTRNKEFEWSGAVSDANSKNTNCLRADSPYFIASVTKIFTATAIMLLYEQKKLDLENPISRFISNKKICGIHKIKDYDHTNSLKIYHLITQTSGLADYFGQKNRQGKSMMNTLLTKGDMEWNLDTVLDLTRNSLTSKFPPAVKQGGGQKAFYSDTNYQLLGTILENIYNKTLGEIFHTVFFEPLDLKESYVFGDDFSDMKREKPVPIYFKDKTLDIPKAMKSFGPDGAIISTAKEQVQFLKALFEGKIFQETKTLEWMQQWNKIFFPLEYGYGLMRYKLPRFMSPFTPIPAFIGHSGASGSFAFFCPEQDFYTAGTFNQINKPSAPFSLLLKIAQILK